MWLESILSVGIYQKLFRTQLTKLLNTMDINLPLVYIIFPAFPSRVQGKSEEVKIHERIAKLETKVDSICTNHLPHLDGKVELILSKLNKVFIWLAIVPEPSRTMP